MHWRRRGHVSVACTADNRISQRYQHHHHHYIPLLTLLLCRCVKMKRNVWHFQTMGRQWKWANAIRFLPSSYAMRAGFNFIAREWISFMRCWHSHRSGISPSPSGHMILDIEDSFFCWVLCDAAQHIPRAVELMPFTFCVSQVKRKDVTAECVAFAQFSDGVEVFSEAFMRNFP